jgi:hypothetical protein
MRLLEGRNFETGNSNDINEIMAIMWTDANFLPVSGTLDLGQFYRYKVTVKKCLRTGGVLILPC